MCLAFSRWISKGVYTWRKHLFITYIYIYPSLIISGHMFSLTRETVHITLSVKTSCYVFISIGFIKVGNFGTWQQSPEQLSVEIHLYLYWWCPSLVTFCDHFDAIVCFQTKGFDVCFFYILYMWISIFLSPSLGVALQSPFLTIFTLVCIQTKGFDLCLPHMWTSTFIIAPFGHIFWPFYS